MSPDPRRGQERPPELRRIGEGLRTDRVQHGLGCADVGQMGFAAEGPPGQKQVPGLEAEEGHGRARHDGGAPDRPRIAIDPGGNVDGDNGFATRSRPKVHSLNKNSRLAIKIPGQPGPEEAIDDQACGLQIQSRTGLDGPRPAPCGLRRIAPQAIHLAQQMDPYAKPALPQQARGDEAIAAVVSRPAKDDDPAPIRR